MQNSPSTHSKQVAVLELFMTGHYDRADWVSLMLAVLARNHSIYGCDDQAYMIYDIPDADAFEPVLRRCAPLTRPTPCTLSRCLPSAVRLIDHRDFEISEHLQTEVFSAERAEIQRLLCGLSGNRLDWSNSLYKYDHAARDEGGNRIKRWRNLLGPGSKQFAPELYPRKGMKEFETVVLSDPARKNIQQADGKGAEVDSFDEVLYAAHLKVGRDAHTLGWATAGTKDNPHDWIITGDGCGATADDSACAMRIAPASVNGSNQSSSSTRDLAVWRGTNVENHTTVLARIKRWRKRLCELHVDGRMRRADGSLVLGADGEPVYVRLILTGDKPFMCHVLGRQNMNADAFSFMCDCRDSKDQLYKLDFDKLLHYEGISFETRCGRALVPLWEALEQPEPETWEVYNDIRKKVPPPNSLVRI